MKAGSTMVHHGDGEMGSLCPTSLIGDGRIVPLGDVCCRRSGYGGSVHVDVLAGGSGKPAPRLKTTAIGEMGDRDIEGGAFSVRT